MANDETYSGKQREEVQSRLQRFQDEQKAINDQILILKGRYSNQIYQIRESIMKFLDKETGTLGERIRTLFKEQGITIVSILTTLGMTLGVLIEALLGGPSTTSAPTSQSTTTSDKKGGAREWIKNKLKALSQLLGKLADKALASLPGIGIRTITPQTITPQTITPRQIPPRQLPPRTNTPRTFTPLRNFSSTYLGILCTYILHILFFLEEPNIHFMFHIINPFVYCK